MARAKEEAFKKLKMDVSFFHQLMMRDATATNENDFDVYLMENGVMPLVLEGLDALCRHVDKLKSGSTGIPSRIPFNPLTWLAQYLIRNHPRLVRDHRTPVYEQFKELASIERGQRCLLRRRPEMESQWQKLEKEKDTNKDGGGLMLADIPQFVQTLDSTWNLGGVFVERLPDNIAALLQLPEGQQLIFLDFWRWFEQFVLEHDVLREAEFLDGARRRVEEEQQILKAKLEAERREKAVQAALAQRAVKEDLFEAVTADMYIDDEITGIINKGAVIVGVEEKEEGPQLTGDHIALIIRMLAIWGYPLPADSPRDTWTDVSLAIWQRWLEERSGLSVEGELQVDAAGLRRLMNRDAFQEYLAVSIPVEEIMDESELLHTVEIHRIVNDDIEVVVEAMDEDTGEVLCFTLPELYVSEVRQRLDASESVFARVDTVGHRVMELLQSY
mmetsp:Transcript_71017/g.154357  ORF Transcript_71017/g.154357 Transcript_71017/m.154357 type:complete len:444 (+) Transcript_71017:88-1419(+)|eukprot:CAMPEP_0170605274 /NCGR_PEP_ID=MMETSP0224-20130122/19888_1 /TAXON_ID=285029 /ORGANISM="Togula jolla, Strain CCCM 725" /LENGTH=443 /DNA_ID=CAMNT_0010930271 /DNA_START=32 /DNA_END=1363 /DNA_ORIENTATION=-